MVRSALAVRALRRPPAPETSGSSERILRRLLQENLRLRSELRELRRLRRWARQDELTGLSDRHLFEERLNEELSRASRDSRVRGSLLVADVSHLKRGNDRFRHASGDEVLRETARILHAPLRPADVCCRIGGDVFMILLPDTDAEGARLVMTRLRAEVFRTGARHDTPIAISLGAASWPADGGDGVALLRKADAAVYLEKRRRAARERRRPTGFGHPFALVK